MLFKWLAGMLVDKLIAPFTTLFTAYINKQISIEELREKMVVACVGAFTSIETSHSETLAKTFGSFMQATEKSLLLQVVWASVTISQLLVLLWHQVGIPAIVALHWVKVYPSSGGTVEWAYALVGACVGLGPMVLRTGPADSLGMLARLKALIAR